MAAGVSTALSWHVDNTTTLDTGASIDVRALVVTPPGTNAADQTFNVANTGDNVNRWWDPGTIGNADASDSTNVLLRRGWAIPLASMLPTDTRCRAVLPAQSLTINVDANLSWTGTPIGSSTMSARASLWKYNPTTDVGSKIGANEQAFPQPWGGVLQPASGEYQIASVRFAVTETILERDEILLVQIGVRTVTMADPLTGTVNYVSQLRHGTTTSSRLVFDSALRAVCTTSDSVPGVATSVKQPLLVRYTEPVSGVGVSAKTLVVIQAERSVSGVGAPAKSARVWATRSVPGVGTPSRTALVRSTRSVDGVGTAAKTAAVSVTEPVSGVGTPDFERFWEAFRYLEAEGVGTTAFTRTVIFVRSATASAVGEVDPNQARIELPIADLPTAGEGGTVNIRKIFPVFA